MLTAFPMRTLTLCVAMCWLAAPMSRIHGEDAATVIGDIFGARMKEARGTKTASDDVALAREMLEATAAAAKTPKLVELLCENAYQLAKDSPAGFPVAVEALERLAKDQPAAKRSDSLGRAAPIAQKWHASAARDQKPAIAERYLSILCQLASAREEAKDLTGAFDSWRKAQVLANSTGSDRVGAIKADVARVQARLDLEKRIAVLQTKLLSDANDAVSALSLVRCYLIEMDDPRQASRFVDRITDNEFKTMMPLAADEVTRLSPLQQMGLGDWYSKLGKDVTGAARAAMQKRAVTCYRAFLDSPAAAKDELRAAKARLSIKHLAPDDAEVSGEKPPSSTPAAQTPVDNKDVIRLVDLKPASVSVPLQQDWQIHRVPFNVAEPLTSIDAQTCREFLFAHAPSKLVYALPPDAESFTAIGFCERRSQVEYRVLVDDQQLFASRGSMAVVKVNIPRGGKTLTLITDDMGDRGWKHTFWCYPRLRVKGKKPGEDNAVNLTDLTPLSTDLSVRLDIRTGQYPLGVSDYPFDRWPCVSREVQACKEYLWAPPPLKIEYDLPPGVKRFTAIAYSVAGGDAQFRVVVDGRTLFRTDYAGVVPVDISLPAGAKRLALLVDPTLNWMEHGFWCFPRLHLSEGPSSSGAKPGPRPNRAKSDGQIDLLANMDLDNATSGVWSWRGGELVGSPRNFAKTDFGWQVRGSYELEVAFTRVTGREGVTLHLPVADTWTLISLGGWNNRFHGLHALDTGNGHANETTRQASLALNRKYVAVVSVQLGRQGQVRIDARLDGAQLFQWEGPITRLRNPDRVFDPPDPAAVGVGANFNELIVHEAWLRPRADASVRRMDRSISRGGQGGSPFMVMPRGAGLLAGFRYTTTKWGTHTVLGSIEPIFITPTGRELGAIHGQVTGEPVEVVARPGFAIGSVEVRGGFKADAFRCTFMRITTTGLNPLDSYQSDWHGGNPAGASMLGNVGRPIVGIYGRSSGDIDALGLVYAPEGRLSVWQGAGDAVADRTKKPPEPPNAKPPAGQPQQSFFGIPTN